jgi:hypothetical protein
VSIPDVTNTPSQAEAPPDGADRPVDRQRPPYVNRWEITGSPQPFGCVHMLSYHFALRGNQNNLQDLLDRYLNNPAQGKLRFIAASPYVLVTFNRARRIYCQTGPYRRLGWSSETEVTIFVPIAQVQRKGGVEYVDRLAFFIPYIFVDNGAALTWGREVYGFPKEFGWAELPMDPHLADRFSVDVQGLRIFSERSQMRRLRLFEIERNDSTPGSLDSERSNGVIWNNIGDFLNGLRQSFAGKRPFLLPSVTFAKSALTDVLRWDVPLIFLRQYYATDDGSRACYQAIVEAPMHVSTLHEARLLGDYRFVLYTCDSHPLETDLGISTRQAVDLAFVADFDGTFERGRTLWEAP